MNNKLLQLIPPSMRGINARKKLSQEQWFFLTSYLKEENGHRCDSCGIHQVDITKEQVSPIDGGVHRTLEAHEVWDFVNIDGIYTMRLTRIRVLCPYCHAMCHPRRWETSHYLAFIQAMNQGNSEEAFAINQVKHQYLRHYAKVCLGFDDHSINKMSAYFRILKCGPMGFSDTPNRTWEYLKKKWGDYCQANKDESLKLEEIAHAYAYHHDDDTFISNEAGERIPFELDLTLLNQYATLLGQEGFTHKEMKCIFQESTSPTC